MARILAGIINEERQYPTSYKAGVKLFSNFDKNGKQAITFYCFWQKYFYWKTPGLVRSRDSAFYPWIIAPKKGNQKSIVKLLAG
jgi:hypothetical protein